jgi:hypothetical protein
MKMKTLTHYAPPNSSHSLCNLRIETIGPLDRATHEPELTTCSTCLEIMKPTPVRDAEINKIIAQMPMTCAEDSQVSKPSNKYLRSVPTKQIDVYRVLHAFGVTDPCIQHAIKKLLARALNPDLPTKFERAIQKKAA